MNGKSDQMTLRLEPNLMARVTREAEDKDVSAAHIVRETLKEKFPDFEMKVADFREVLGEGERRRDALSKRFEIDDDGYLIIDGWYEIELSRADSYDKILSWVLHLGEKNWAQDHEFIRYFVQICLRQAKLGFPQA